MFDKHNISIEYLDYSDYKTYRQMFGDFEHHVSIVDLLFNEGPNSVKYLKSIKNE